MLIGVGLGPGDPELMTLAAIKALKNSTKVFVPGKLSAELVEPYARSEKLDFPMIKDRAKLSELWEKNAAIVAEEAEKGIVSFAVLGDPNFFSTFSHLRRAIKEKYPGIEITTIPGVSAITAQAARTGTSIEGSFIVSDGSPVSSEIILKAKNPALKKEELIKEGYEEIIYAERLFMEKEMVTKEIPETGDYFSIMIAKKGEKTSDKKIVYFIGAGPGDPKYITVKGRELLESADLIIYTGSLVNPEVLRSARGNKVDSHWMKLEEIVDALVKSVHEGKTAVRLHSGDPSLYGAIIEQIEELKKRDIDVRIIPGVSSLFASAAALKKQLTLKGLTETLIITRPAGITLPKDSLQELSRHNATMAIYLGAHKIREIMNELMYSRDTPAAVVYHASWEDEKIITGTVGDIADKVEILGIDRSAMIIIGDVLSPENYMRSHLYG
ncbi:MAG TPA: cobalt-factor II C(20)-methyltransferase [Candidatus Methanoperedens sp.]|nr:cobalt-factor II C(20)-methyltransferase [Candidatus Methanoperedens sp.]